MTVLHVLFFSPVIDADGIIEPPIGLEFYDLNFTETAAGVPNQLRLAFQKLMYMLAMR